MSFCKSCGWKIIWAKTENGKSIPIDAIAYADGNICLIDGVAYVAPKDTAALIPGPLFKSHFATCPNAKSHRKPKTQMENT